MSDALVETTDIAATIMTHLGLPCPRRVRVGRSRRSWPTQAATTETPCSATSRTGRWSGPAAGNSGRHGDGDGELYDWRTTRPSCSNLYHLPALAGVRGDLLSRYALQMLENQRVRAQIAQTAPDQDRERAIASLDPATRTSG